MNPETQKAVEAGKLSTAHGIALDKLTTGTCVLHRSWGFGRIASTDYALNQVIIDFSSKKGHPMQLVYAAESLTPIDPDHILAQISADLAGVRTRAKEDPAKFVGHVLSCYGNKLTQDQLTQVLVPSVFKEPDFKKWWESAKKILKKDGHFSLPTKKSDPIVFRSEAVSRADEHLVAFSEARQLKDQIGTLERILRDLEEFKDHATQLQPIITAVEESARKNSKLATAEALTLLVLRDELTDRSKSLTVGETAPLIATVLIEEQRALHTLLEQVPAAKLKRTLAAFPAAFGEDWTSKALSLITRGSTRLVTEAARLLQEQNKADDLKTTLDRSIRDHSISSAALTWLCDKKERSGDFRDLIQPRVVSAILSALERDQFNENRDRKLHDLLMNDLTLLPDLIADAELEELREVMRKLLLSPVFEDLNKRSLLGRFVRSYPELESLITGDREEKQETLIASWDSLEKRQLEYDELVSKKIPEIIKEISVAREHGDLRENFEYHAAKQQRTVLERRKAEMERDNAMARGTDFANADTSIVSIGTSVTIRGIKDQQSNTYHILGVWDTDPEKHIISYKAAIAQALLGKKVGEQVDVPTEQGDRLVEIVAIAAWAKA
ncbi:MAG: GreA/GreB family elongation factor [Verrucomicrobiota bacterium]